MNELWLPPSVSRPESTSTPKPPATPRPTQSASLGNRVIDAYKNGRNPYSPFPSLGDPPVRTTPTLDPLESLPRPVELAAKGVVGVFGILWYLFFLSFGVLGIVVLAAIFGA